MVLYITSNIYPMNYFISDLHINHRNILTYDGRPFRTVEENNITIMDNWNQTVTPNDNVYILGDIGFGDPNMLAEYYRSLNGIKHLIRGNHDTPNIMDHPAMAGVFAEICDYKELYINPNLSVVLCHYPIVCFKNSFYGWIHLYGHVHNNTDWKIVERAKMCSQELYSKAQSGPKNDVCRMYNVGCMLYYMNYTPRTLEQILISNEDTVKL